jgi:hypothetical protein
MNSSPPSKMQLARQFIRLALISGGIFLAFVIIVSGLLTFHHRDSVIKLFADNLQSRLQAETSIGDIRFRVFRTFPMASLSLSDVVILEASPDTQSDTLLQAASVKLQFSITDLIRKKYTIRQVVIENGVLQPGISHNGTPNYLFGQPNNDKAGEAIHFDIRRLLLNDIRLRYADQKAGHLLDCDISNIRLTGRFAGRQNSIKARGNLHLNSLHIKNTPITGNKSIFINTNVKTGDMQGWQISPSQIKVDGHQFTLAGEGTTRNGQQWTDLIISGKQLPIAQLMPELPPSAGQALAPYHPDGIVSFDGQLSGFLQDGQVPDISVSFSIHEGTVRLPQNNVGLHRISAQGSFTNGHSHNAASSKLNINTLSAQTATGRSSLNGHGSISNFMHPQISLRLKAESAADEFLDWLNIEHITEAEGRAGFDITFAGSMSNGKNFTGKDLLEAELAGTTTIKDVSFILKDNHLLAYREFNGKMAFDDNRMVIEELSGKAGSSDFHFGGNIRNLLPYLFIPEEVMVMEAIMHANHIRLDELLRQSKTESDTTYKLRFSNRLRLEMDASVKELHFGRFEAQKIHGNARLMNQILTADHLSFNTMDGSVVMTGRINGSLPEQIKLLTNAHLDKVDINRLFYQMGNFGQSGFTDQNLEGSVTADIMFSAMWSPALEIDWDSMETNARLRIEDGRLIDYAPMMALGRFIRTGHLDNIAFSTLENEIHIKNKQIMIPMMQISSSVLNLQLSGMHGFANVIDYRIRVLLSELLAREHRERRNPQEQYGEIIDDGLGRTTLFLRLTGTAQDPVFRYDQAGVREKISDDLHKERQNLRDILREEFSFLSRQPQDTIKGATDELKQERERIRKQEEGEFIIEWE